jgi:hypothetical protein
VFDLLGNPILELLAAKRQGLAEELLTETRRPVDQAPGKVGPAQSTRAEDQVFLSGAAPLPPPPLPLTPGQPVGTRNRVADALRRLRALRRRAGRPGRSAPPGESEDGSAGHCFDRWA